MTKKSSIPQHLKSAQDLVTTYEARRAGFVSLALERNRKATPYVEEARALQVQASKVSKPLELLKLPDIRFALLTAAGISDKALHHLKEPDKISAINNLIKEFLDPAGEKFVEELVFRFLLTRGDTLGGSMRNFGGQVAQRKLAGAMLSTLNLWKIKIYCLYEKRGDWVLLDSDTSNINDNLRGIQFISQDKRQRFVMFNVKVPIVNKNVDICLLSHKKSDSVDDVICNHDSYIALGELKGGIDPAGADEHWKTAGSSLKRIRDAFRKKKLSPEIFFIGAAIEDDMAKEIWKDLKSGDLASAANLTVPNQLYSLVQWMLKL